MPGELIVCPTPIGNLDDVSPRARDALVVADWIACEDTRRTGGLLDKLGIRPAPPLVSNHEGNEAARATELAQRIERGDVVVLISDAGMPAISDPGFRLIRRCIERNLDVTVLPGPSVIPVALVASGLPTDRWRFEGFLPKRPGELERVLQDIQTGLARQAALEAFAERTDVRDIRSFVTAIGQAGRYGVAVSDALRVQATESRERRKAAVEERAQKTTVKLLFPLMFCILPALFVVILGPAALRIAKLPLGG